MTVDKDRQQKSNSNSALADEALMLELLADLDLEAPVTAAFVATSPALMAVAAKRGAKAGRSQSASAKAERERYRLVKVSEEKGEPRPYHDTGIAPQQIAYGNAESPDDYKRRYKRDYARLKRGVTAEGIEARAIIREMITPEEKKRKRADAEKARRAAKKNSAPSAT